MTNTLVMFDDRNLRTFGDGADQALAPAGHAEIDVLREGEQLFDGIAFRGGDELNGVLRKRRQGSAGRLDHDAGDALIRMQGFLPPRRMVAFPDLKQSAAASAVTFGRDS